MSTRQQKRKPVPGNEGSRQAGGRRPAARFGAGPELAPPSVHEVLQGAGQPLEGGLRQPMEARLGHDFSRVRVHTGTRAAESARTIGARAYTVGRHVVFGDGELAPHTPEGRRALAHELTHVAQQRGASTRWLPARLPIAPARGAAEHEAENRARSVTEPGLLVPQRSTTPVAPAVQRIGVGEWLARFFGGGTFSEQELQDYLAFLDREKRPMGTFESDNMAREVVARWGKGEADYILSVERKILLIREMLKGFTGDDDENAILALLRGATATELSRIMSEIGKGTLDSAFQGAEQKGLDELVKNRQAAVQGPKEDTSGETFGGKEIIALQQRFKSNAADTNRLNCILIVRDQAPRLFASDPTLAASVKSELGKLSGGSLKMTEVGRVMSTLGLVNASAEIKFDGANGIKEPTAMKTSAWDTIMGMVGSREGWHVFGMAVFNGYHSVTVLVEKRGDSVKLYWADQWRIDPGDEFYQSSGSVSGFRRYEKEGFDKILNELTNSWWNDKNDEGKQWKASLWIWEFRSAINAPAGNAAPATPASGGGAR